MHKEIGEKINELRSTKGMTLKELGDKANLSISFLSQAERGLTSVTINSLKKIAQALEVELNYFFTPPKSHRPMIMRSYEQEVFRFEQSKVIYYNLGSDMENKQIDPVIIVVLPTQSSEEIIPCEHPGEEFIYVLEGVLTIFLDDKQYELYAGDSTHIASTIPHDYCNYTSKLVKLLVVSTPSVFK